MKHAGSIVIITCSAPCSIGRRSLAAAVLPAAVLLLACGVNSVGATGLTLGVGAGVDAGHADCVSLFECDRSSTHVKLTLGYQIDPRFDVQLAYLDAGKFKGGDITPLGTQFGGTFKVSGVGLTGGYRYDFAPRWSLTARAGLSSMRTRFAYASPFAAIASVSETKVQPLVGLGIGYAVTPQLRIGLDYDLTRFKVYMTRGNLQMLGIAAQYAF